MKGIRSKVEVLTQNEIEAIHKSTLNLLENVGIKISNKECLDICRKAGAVIDESTDIVKIPAGLMKDMLDKVKAAGLDKGEKDKPEKLCGHISTQVFVVDYKTKTRRYGVMDDVMKGIALVDHLHNIESYNAVTIPSDVPHNMTDILSYQKIYSYSKKPGGTFILSPTSAKYIIQMSKVVGKEVPYLLETVSPLQFRKESLEMALVFAKEGQPLIIGPMVVGGATGPVTLAGIITLQNAEILASLFLVYLLTQNYTYYSGSGHSMDLRTTICSFGSPNQALIGMASAQMARFYGLKANTNSALSDANMPDFQCGFEKASTAIFSCLSGCSITGAQGIAGADQGFSMEQLVLDNEWLDTYNYILGGFEVNEETIAADIIKSVGIAGNFIAEEHTAEYMRESYWISRFFNRDSWDAWMANGSKDSLDKAYDFVQQVTANYKSMEPVIDSGKYNEISYIVKCADEELAKER